MRSNDTTFVPTARYLLDSSSGVTIARRNDFRRGEKFFTVSVLNPATGTKSVSYVETAYRALRMAEFLAQRLV